MFRTIGDLCSEASLLKSEDNKLSSRPRQDAVLASLSIIFGKSIEELTESVQSADLGRLDLLVVTKQTTIMDGFHKSLIITKKAMKKCVLPYLFRHKEIIKLDFTYTVVWETTLFKLAEDSQGGHNKVKTVFLTRLFQGKATLDLNVIGAYDDIDMVMYKGLHTIYRINPHFPDSADFIKVVKQRFKYDPLPAADSGVVLEAVDADSVTREDWQTLIVVHAWNVREVTVPLLRGPMPIK